MSESTLILPDQQPRDSVDTLLERLPDVVWLRNPTTGVIYKYLKKQQADSIRHALKGETGEGGRQPYTLSSEEAARKQAVELAQLQGRPLPPWAADEEQAERQAEQAESQGAGEAPARAPHAAPSPRR